MAPLGTEKVSLSEGGRKGGREKERERERSFFKRRGWNMWSC